MLYAFSVYSGKKLRLRYRDSFHILPKTLDSLGCPELGCKGSIDHSAITVYNLKVKEVLNYMRQDIRLPRGGGVLVKAQAISLKKEKKKQPYHHKENLD